jgi:thioredoxin reductase
MQTYDVLIIGGGPAGLNAALVLARCRRSVLVVDAGEPRNAPSRALHGFLTRDGMAPADFLRLGREEVEGYGVDIVNAKVTEARTLDGEPGAAFEVTVEDGRTLRSRKLLLATGIRDRLPDVDGANDFFGRGLYYCPYCDAWEHRDEPIATFGRGRAAVGAAVALTTWSDDVTACTDGEPISDDDRAWLDANGVALREEPVTRLEGGDALERVCFAEGPPLACRALFFNTSRTQHSPLPRLLGCESDEHGEIVTNSDKTTCVPGLFVAGDADGDTEFIVVAAAEGARAAVAINHELQEESHAPRLEKPVPAAPQ